MDTKVGTAGGVLRILRHCEAEFRSLCMYIYICIGNLTYTSIMALFATLTEIDSYRDLRF